MNNQKDHPRLCGEKTTLRTVVQCDAGITPAYAGKSFKGECSGSDKRDHPRLCGEMFSNFLLNYSFVGSRLRMRGKDSVALFVFCFVRITPAYAGKRDSDDNINSELEDHPRLCGEKMC